MLEVCREHRIEAVHWNEEYGVNEQQRDAATQDLLEQAGILTHGHLDQLLLRPGSVLTRSGHYFQVFGQFRRACLEHLHLSLPSLAPPVKRQAPLRIASDPSPGLHRFSVPTAKCARALASRRKRSPSAPDPLHRRDGRGLSSTTGPTRPDRHQPTLAILGCRRDFAAPVPARCLEREPGRIGQRQRRCTNLDQRAAVAGVLQTHPGGLSTGLSTPGLPRPHRSAALAGCPRRLEAWKTGRTGFPIVDAAMRQLLHTGWMHNRLRMVVAMFLSKTC